MLEGILSNRSPGGFQMLFFFFYNQKFMGPQTGWDQQTGLDWLKLHAVGWGSMTLPVHSYAGWPVLALLDQQNFSELHKPVQLI